MPSVHFEVGCPCGSDPYWHDDWKALPVREVPRTAECQSIYDTGTWRGPMKCTRLLFPDHHTECAHWEHSATWSGRTWFWTTDQQMMPQAEAERFYQERGNIVKPEGVDYDAARE